jgi:hypothetical protein
MYKQEANLKTLHIGKLLRSWQSTFSLNSLILYEAYEHKSIKSNL